MPRNTVFVFNNPLEPTEHDLYQSDKNIIEVLTSVFENKLPDNTRIFYESISDDNDVTPRTEEGIERLSELEGLFYIVQYPEGGSAIVWFAVAAIVAAVAAVVLLTPKISASIPSKNRTSESPNNSLSNRSNTARPLERIPDIYGTVFSIPDLLNVPYSKFEDNIEYELVYMCVGRGFYDIPETTIKEDDTPASLIDGTSVEIYKPYTSPNSGTAQIQIGEAITEPLYYVIRSNNVDGQTLDGNGDTATGEYAFGTNFTVGTPEFTMEDGYVISPIKNNPFFLDELSVGDFVTIEAIVDVWTLSEDTFGRIAEDVDFSGVYEIEDIGTRAGLVYQSYIKLVNPELVNPNWATYAGYYTGYYYGGFYGGRNFPTNVTITKSIDTDTLASEWVYIYDRTINKISNNFVALQGLYKDNGTTQTAIDVDIKVEWQKIDKDGLPVGEIFSDTATVVGSSTTRRQRGTTLLTDLGFTDRCRVRATRITPQDKDFSGTVVDEIKWRDLYGLYEITDDDFGDVTTVYTRTKATEAATSLRDRKLNIIVTRKVPEYVGGGAFNGDINGVTDTGLIASNRADDILFAVSLDTYIGNRDSDNIDYDQIQSAADTVVSYFGNSKSIEFCYTFDKSNISYEETAQLVADAMFCTAYRRGNLIKTHFEKQTDSSVLIFNHRNKIPNSERRTIQFGIVNNYDGVEYTWTDPDDKDAVATYYIVDGLESETPPVNPYKVESVGVRNYRQAYWHAWREYNRLRYQHTTVEFDSVGQGEIVLIGDRVLVSNNMRGDVQEGDVEGYEGMIISTSQPVYFEGGVNYTIFLQLYDGTIQSMTASKVEGNDYAVLLGSSPLLTLVFDDDESNKTKYMLVKASESDSKSAFILTDRQQNDNNVSSLTLINYDDRYYDNDTDPLAGISGWGYNWGNYFGGI